MKKSTKIILSCACAVFIIAIIGFGIWKMTYASPAAGGSQDSSMDSKYDETGSIKITTPDGSEWIIVNPPIPDNDSNAENIEWEWNITNFDHAEMEG